jgi:flavodoxin
MRTLIVVNSHKGNTRAIADAIAGQLKPRGSCEVVNVEAAGSSIGADVDLLLVGSPTEGHGMTPEIRAYLDALAASSVHGKAVAAFDTRIGWPRILSGSAADGIAAKLARLDARVIGPQGSFIVTTTPALEPGEIERARSWADQIASEVSLVAA